jgi:hypothetical protein
LKVSIKFRLLAKQKLCHNLEYRLLLLNQQVIPLRDERCTELGGSYVPFASSMLEKNYIL